ncbi:hypothetical protein ACHAQH_001984 [Verticillium albo-atrum]
MAMYLTSWCNITPTSGRAGSVVPTNEFWKSLKLGIWDSSDHSALIAIKGPSTTRSALQDFCVGVISQLLDDKMPVLWALRGPAAAGSDAAPTTVDFLRYLTSQAMKLYEKLPTEKAMSLMSSKFQAATTPQEWFDLFTSAISVLRAKRLYLVLDLHTIEKAAEPWDDFNLIEKILGSFKILNMELKVVVIAYKRQELLDAYLAEQASDVIVRVKKAGPRSVERGNLRSSDNRFMRGNRRRGHAVGLP